MFSVSQVHNVSQQYSFLFKFRGLIRRYIVLYVLPKKSFHLPNFNEIRGLVGSQNGANMHLSTSLQDPAINLYTSIVHLIYFRRLSENLQTELMVEIYSNSLVIAIVKVFYDEIELEHHLKPIKVVQNVLCL